MEPSLEQPGTGARWGLAALLGCGACCGGLAGTLAWAGATTAALGAFALGWVLLGVALLATAVVLLVRRRRQKA